METTDKQAKKYIKKIELDKELNKRINEQKYYNYNCFIRDAKRFINATKKQTMCCVIHSVASSGMSRVISFHSCEKGEQGKSYYANYSAFMCALGYRESKTRNGFTVSGCGMDMIFATHYNIIHKLDKLGFLNQEETRVLSQRTPVSFY